MVVSRARGGLQYKDIAPAHVLKYFDGGLAVGKPPHIGAAQRNRKAFGNVGGKPRIGIAREQHDAFGRGAGVVKAVGHVGRLGSGG